MWVYYDISYYEGSDVILRKLIMIPSDPTHIQLKITLPVPPFIFGDTPLSPFVQCGRHRRSMQ